MSRNRLIGGGEEPGRWVLWIPVGLGVGIGLFFAAPVEPSPWAGPFSFAVFLVLAAAPPIFRRPALSKSFPLVLLGLLVTLGFTAAGIQTRLTGTVLLAPSDRFMTVTGHIERIERRPGRTRLTIGVTAIDPVVSEPLPVRLRVSTAKQTDTEIGDLVSVRAVMRGPGPPAVPGGFDFRRWSWFQQLGGSGFAVGPVELLARSDSDGWRVMLNRLRDTIAVRIRQAYPDQAGAIAAAVIVGDRSALNEETLDAMRASGLAHLLAISGLHLGLLAGTVFFGLRFAMAGFESAALDFSIKKIAASVALVTCLFYVFLAGAPIPTIRAFIMTGLVLIAVLADRSAISMRLVAWAAAVVLMLQPESMLGPSFQMSFAAVIALVAFYEAFAPRWRNSRSQAGPVKIGLLYLTGIIFTTIIAGAATAPFAWHHFGQVGGYGAVANLAAIPIMAFVVMPFALLGLLAMPFGLESIVFWPAITGLHGILTIAKTIGALEGALLRFPMLPVAGLLAVVAGGLWLCLWRARWRHFGWIGITVGVSIGMTAPRPDILVSGDARLMGVGFDTGTVLALNTIRRERFTADQWRQAYGFDYPVTFADEKERTDFGCDRFGCLLTRKDRTVALVSDPRALIDDCRLSDVVIAPIPVYRRLCDRPETVIDFFSLYRNGAHALFITESGITIETAEKGGDRLWLRPAGER
ncbi:MAG: ComEC/Rec2 family competence protein [Alphaproteobacteria bacterium]